MATQFAQSTIRRLWDASMLPFPCVQSPKCAVGYQFTNLTCEDYRLVSSSKFDNEDMKWRSNDETWSRPSQDEVVMKLVTKLGPYKVDAQSSSPMTSSSPLHPFMSLSSTSLWQMETLLVCDLSYRNAPNFLTTILPWCDPVYHSEVSPRKVYINFRTWVTRGSHGQKW